MQTQYEVIFCIVNAGFSDVVMDAAKEAGARGGTVIHARGTANKEAEQFFHITIQPDKDVVMILVSNKIKDAVLHALYNRAGLRTAGQGIVFSLPVNDVAGVEKPQAVQPGSGETAADGSSSGKIDSAPESAGGSVENDAASGPAGENS